MSEKIQHFFIHRKTKLLVENGRPAAIFMNPLFEYRPNRTENKKYCKNLYTHLTSRTTKFLWKFKQTPFVVILHTQSHIKNPLGSKEQIQIQESTQQERTCTAFNLLTPRGTESFCTINKEYRKGSGLQDSYISRKVYVRWVKVANLIEQSCPEPLETQIK